MTKIMFIGESWGRHEAEAGKPFVGPSGKLLHSFRNAVGIDIRDCYLTNLINFQPDYNNFASLCGSKSEGIPNMPPIERSKYLRAEYFSEYKRLLTEIDTVNPNLIVPLGGKACWAVLKNSSIRKLRGAPITTITGHKALPTYHPAAVLREMKLRPIVYSDFEKIAKECEFPELRRPEREFWLEPTLSDLAAFEPHILSAKVLSVDIETWSRQITCIGFATSEARAIVIPFVWHGTPDGNYWRSMTEELTAWSYVRKWLNLGIPLVGQNILYDLNYLWSKYGIRATSKVKSGSNLLPVNDTMLLHHAAQPELEKSLGFLSSIYTSEPQHKFMRGDIKTLKKED